MNSKISHIAENILIEAYGKLGIEVEMAYYPGLRSILSADEGTVDGELMRIREIGNEYKNLIMIPVSILYLDGVVFSKIPDLLVDGFESLSPYSMAIQRGIKFIEYNTVGMKRIFTDTLDHAFSLLDRDRVDIVVTTRIEGLEQISASGYEAIFINEPPVVRIDLFHYLHSDHEKLVPEITRVLEAMKSEGAFLIERELYIDELIESSGIDIDIQ